MHNIEYDDRSIWTDDDRPAPLISRIVGWSGAAFLTVAAALTIWILLDGQRTSGAATVFGQPASPPAVSWGPVLVAAAGGVLLLTVASLLTRFGRLASSRDEDWNL